MFKRLMAIALFALVLGATALPTPAVASSSGGYLCDVVSNANAYYFWRDDDAGAHYFLYKLYAGHHYRVHHTRLDTQGRWWAYGHSDQSGNANQDAYILDSHLGNCRW